MNRLFKLNNAVLIALLLLLGCFGSTPVIAQTDGAKLLEAIQEKFNEITDLSATFTQSVNRATKLTGKIFYKKYNKIKFELDNLIIVSDGGTNWNYNKKENKLIISSYDEDDPGLFSLENIIFKYPEECEITAYIDDNQEVLMLMPKTSLLNFNSVKLWINNSSLIVKALVDDPTAGIVQFDLNNYKLNQDLPDSEFTFTQPEGSKVIDLR